jgi:hypothetical protein
MQNIWIFQLTQVLEPSSEANLKRGLDQLMVDWKAHGTPVPGTYEIRYHRFVIVQSAPGATSGCSIDSMTHGVEDLLSTAGVKPLPHNNILYRNAAGEIELVDFREVGAAISAGKLGPDTIVFDMSLGQTQDLNRFEVRLADSWLKRYLEKVG